MRTELICIVCFPSRKYSLTSKGAKFSALSVITVWQQLCKVHQQKAAGKCRLDLDLCYNFTESDKKSKIESVQRENAAAVA